MKNLEVFFKINEDIFDTKIGVDSLIDEKIKELKENIDIDITYKLNSNLSIKSNEQKSYTALNRKDIENILDICRIGNIYTIYLETCESSFGWQLYFRKNQTDFKGIEIISTRTIKLIFSKDNISIKNLTLEVNNTNDGILITKNPKLINCNFKAPDIVCFSSTFPVLVNCNIKSIVTSIGTHHSQKKWPENLLKDMSYADLHKNTRLNSKTTQQIISLLDYDYKQWNTKEIKLMFNRYKSNLIGTLNFKHPNKNNDTFIHYIK